MAAASAVRAVGRRSRRLFDIFVAEVPWTVSSSESESPLPSLTAAGAGELGRPRRVCRHRPGVGPGRRGCAEAPSPDNQVRFPTEELKEYFSQFGSVQRCQLPFVSTRASSRPQFVSSRRSGEEPPAGPAAEALLRSSFPAS